MIHLEMAIGEEDEETLIRRLQEAVPSYQPLMSKNAQPLV